MPTCFTTSFGPSAPFSQSTTPVTKPDGSTGYVPNTDFANCEFVVLSGSDYQYLLQSPFNMTAEDGAIASGLIVSCWVAAYGVRSVIAVFRGSSKDE